jgi:hypothetical protein
MDDVFVFSHFACPSAVFELSGRVHGDHLVVFATAGVNYDFFESIFQESIPASGITELSECPFKGADCFLTGNIRRPVLLADRPPPTMLFAGCPANAVVVAILFAF